MRNFFCQWLGVDRFPLRESYDLLCLNCVHSKSIYLEIIDEVVNTALPPLTDVLLTLITLRKIIDETEYQVDWTIRKCRKLVAKTRHCNIVVIVAMSEAVKESARKRLFKDKPSRHVKAGMDKRRPINKEESERERKFSTFLKRKSGSKLSTANCFRSDE